MLNKTKAVPSDLYTGYMLAKKMNIYNYLMCKQLLRKITLELLSRYSAISLLEYYYMYYHTNRTKRPANDHNIWSLKVYN